MTPNQDKLSSREKISYGLGDFASCLYWKAISPFHAIVFGGMTRNITGAAEAA